MTITKYLAMLEQLDFNLVRERYYDRLNAHQLLRRAFELRALEDYVPLALGMTNHHGNYSASEYRQGPLILSENPVTTIYRRVYNLAEELSTCTITHIPRIIYRADIDYLKISIGSEMAMMLRPSEAWVGNVRTYWVHFLIENDWDVDAANTVLEAYENGERDAEMNYAVWQHLYLHAGRSLKVLAEAGNIEARNQGVEPGNELFMWADAISTSLYVMRGELE